MTGAFFLICTPTLKGLKFVIHKQLTFASKRLMQNVDRVVYHYTTSIHYKVAFIKSAERSEYLPSKIKLFVKNGARIVLTEPL